MYPEVVVINKLGPAFMMKDISAGGCIYEGVVGYEKATAPMHCLPGNFRVTFKRINLEKYCQTQTEYGNLDGLCLCDGGTPNADTDIISKEPLWYNYMTRTEYRFERGESYIIEIPPDAVDQDFTVPGPYGH